MLATLKALNAAPLWARVAIGSVAVVGAYLFQIPVSTDVPGEPFLLFFAVVVGCALAFGRPIGFLAVATASRPPSSLSRLVTYRDSEMPSLLS